MAKKVYLGEELFGLGALTYPTLTFKERDEDLQQSQPGLKPEERAAIIYFAMLAETPMPTASGEYNSIVYEDLEANAPYTEWPEFEEQTKYHAIPGVTFTQRTLQESYAVNLAHLQRYIQQSNLWTGIKKTLLEQSRRKQAEKAALDAQNAAAAQALAMNAITEEVAQEANERYEKETQEVEAQIQQLEAGIQHLDSSSSISSGSSILPLAAAAAAALLAFKG